MPRFGNALAVFVLPALVSACSVEAPEGIAPVEGFEPARYLGRWYEIARLDHGFEEGLSRVTADYAEREDGGLRVINRGWSAQEGEWQEAEGRAYFVEDRETGFLRVSFFGPFFGAYVIFSLDPGYRWSMVTGDDRSYLWLLARSPEPGQDVIDAFLREAEARGFATEELIFVEHGPLPE